MRLIDRMSPDHEPVTITKRGRPVAILQPVKPKEPASIIGAMRGSVPRFDDPLAPVLEPGDWNAAR
jgi:antitoxin (DNA-binding transcriptional repressor) of toxin-antitoxin stability system